MSSQAVTAAGPDSDFLAACGIDSTEKERLLSLSTPYRVSLSGFVGDRIEANEKNWLAVALKNNPYIIEAIEKRNDKDRDSIVNNITWYGEFPGAFLYGAASCYALTRSASLFETVEALMDRIEAAQSENGYLGTYPDAEQFDPKYWDMGAHFFMLHGLMEWYDATGSARALAIAQKTASLIHRYRCIRKQEISVGQLMVIAPLARLYKVTGDKDTLQLINNLKKLADENCNFYQGGLDRIDFFRLPVHRWENLFDIQAFGDLADIYGDDSYVTSLLNHWNSLLRTDRHTTGGMTTAETTVGSAFTNGSIETCASVLWEDLSATCYAEALSSYMADELELTFYNAILGAQMPDGSVFTYDTPREGRKIPNTEELSWQATSRSPDFNCCSANAARGLGLLHKWATYTDEKGLRVNYYGAGETVTSTPGGNVIVLEQVTGYPADGNVILTLHPEKTETFPLLLRIPFWADGSSLSVNGETAVSVPCGDYYTVTREWKEGDTLTLSLSMNTHYRKAEGDFAQYHTVYYGPLLLVMDDNNNKGWNHVKATLDADTLSFTVSENKNNLLTLKVKTADGITVTLCDFASAGAGKAYYSTWFRVSGAKASPSGIDWDLR